jgi:hypothetical protein
VQPSPPFVLIDDDGWLDVYETFDDLVQSLEWPYLDEIAWLVDSEGRTLILTANSDNITLTDLQATLDLSGLRAAVDRFFAEWTTTPPPLSAPSGPAYITNVVETLRTAAFRSRRKSPSRPT